MKRNLKKTVLSLGVLGLCSFAFLTGSEAEAKCAKPQKVLRMATLAPEGTSLYKGLIAVKEEIKSKTGGCVDIKIFGGGVMGDEKAVVRKMKVGQLHGAALTGVGLGYILADIRVLELPFLFQSEKQVDYVYSKLKPTFQSKFQAKKFQLLGWAGVGFVQIFSNKPISSKDDLKKLKMWMWEGDPLAKAMYDAMGVVPVAVPITDVLTSLQTGLLDAAYAPELGAIALQWHTKTKYITKIDLVYGTGALLLTNKAWQGLSASQKSTVKAVIDAQAKKMTQKSRSDNKESLAVLKQSGLKLIELKPEAEKELREISQKVQKDLTGKLYSKQLLDQVLKHVQAAPK